MKKRDIFVFCGQSNMMGACDFPPKYDLKIKNSVEFKFKNKQPVLDDELLSGLI